MEETGTYTLKISFKTGKEYTLNATTTELTRLFDKMIDGDRGEFASIDNYIVNIDEIEVLSFIEEE